MTLLVLVLEQMNKPAQHATMVIMRMPPLVFALIALRKASVRRQPVMTPLPLASTLTSMPVPCVTTSIILLLVFVLFVLLKRFVKLMTLLVLASAWNCPV
jgi:hypothetical protein